MCFLCERGWVKYKRKDHAEVTVNLSVIHDQGDIIAWYTRGDILRDVVQQSRLADSMLASENFVEKLRWDSCRQLIARIA